MKIELLSQYSYEDLKTAVEDFLQLQATFDQFVMFYTNITGHHVEESIKNLKYTQIHDITEVVFDHFANIPFEELAEFFAANLNVRVKIEDDIMFIIK